MADIWGFTDYLLALRKEIRENEGLGEHEGGCYWLAECLTWSGCPSYPLDERARLFPDVKIAGGCYVTRDGCHADHYWVQVGDTILDATADQFGEGDDIVVTTTDDPRYLDQAHWQDYQWCPHVKMNGWDGPPPKN